MAYNSTASLTNLIEQAWDRKMRLALRAIPQFRMIADARIVQQTHPGETVTFSFYGDLTPTTATLDEITDPDSVAIANPTRISVTLEERGNYTVTTKRLQEFSLDGELNANVANQVAYNQAVSINEVVQQKLVTAPQIVSEEAGSLVGTGNNLALITDTDTIKSRDIRYVITKLRTASTVPVRGSMYGVFLHPEVAHDLRVETGATGWRQPHEYVNPSPLYAGELGTWEGAVFIETPFCQAQTEGAATTVYRSYVFGKEALAEAVAEEPHLVVNGNLGSDVFNRKTSVGWYGILGHSLFRPEPLWQIATASSVA